jgi:hypothetical protein
VAEVVRLVIVGPKYLRVTVHAEVAPDPGAATGNLEANVVGALTRFLHPLTGGELGTGWSFGRKPHASDLYAVIEAVAGVGYVRLLKLDAALEVSRAEQSVNLDEPADEDYFLVYSGAHEVGLVFD